MIKSKEKSSRFPLLSKTVATMGEYLTCAGKSPREGMLIFLYGMVNVRFNR